MFLTQASSFWTREIEFGADRKLLKFVAKDDDTPHAVVAKDGSGDYSSILEAIDAYPNKTIVPGTGFIAKSVGFMNTAGSDGHEVVALRVASDYSTIFDCRIDDATVIIQSSTLIIRKSNNNVEKYAVTALVRSIRQQTATVVIHNCTIVPDEKLFLDRKILRKTPVYNMSMGIAALVPKEVRGSSGLVLNKRIRLGQAYTVLKLLKSDQFLDDVGIPLDGLIYSNTTHDNSLIETTRIGVWIVFN
ncbi:hypothetical protein Patl1_19386 [Pistacia atlantica]|uniref:Uncharacterized protein n=1 Tax=Pistacia atlantica TaxID=434234 RepID=A0ACC1C0C5_9ROSI|nr:hypothetical protein Patl1_19386 [Pistacia atlantica]